MHPDIEAYHAALPDAARAVCGLLAREIVAALPDAVGKV